jgi:hypothetical protein
MGFIDYFQDIGFTYILIIAITAGFGHFTAFKNK